MVKAVIEIPKGDSIRRHLDKSTNSFVNLGEIKDLIPVNNGIMPIHYGFIPNTHNPNDNDELDILVLSDKSFSIGQDIEVLPIALLKRADGDDKIVAVEQDLKIKSWEEIEKDLKELILDYFGYKSKISKVENKEFAEKYIEELRTG